MGKIYLTQAKHYEATQNISNDVKTLIEDLGGVQNLGANIEKAKLLASTLGVSVEEIQGEACDAATEELEKTASANSLMSSSVVKHRGLRVLWQARLANKYKVSAKDFKAAMEIHMSTDLGLDAELVSELMGEHKWSKIIALLDTDEDGFVTISEMRKTFNIISAKSAKDQDLGEGCGFRLCSSAVSTSLTTLVTPPSPQCRGSGPWYDTTTRRRIARCTSKLMSAALAQTVRGRRKRSLEGPPRVPS